MNLSLAVRARTQDPAIIRVVDKVQDGHNIDARILLRKLPHGSQITALLVIRRDRPTWAS